MSKILSIGFEFETNWLTKLCLMEPDNVLFNTGSNSESISEIKKYNNLEVDEDEAAQVLYNMDYQTEEYLEEEIDENTVFHITNDFSVGPIIRKLKKLCEKNMDSKDIYEFQTNDTTHSVQLIQDIKNTNCYEFSFVEWLYTKFAPKQSTNIILDSFFEMMQYLINHLDSLVPVSGELRMKRTNKSKTRTVYTTIDEPVKRLLYNKPGTNLYYLQLHSDNQQKTIDDICGKAQMTFSCKIEDALSIIRSISGGSLRKEVANIERAATKIIDSIGGIAEQSSNARLKASNYLALIFYRIFYYLEYRRNPSMYLKNLMAFNCRHSNYILFEELVNIFNPASASASASASELEGGRSSKGIQSSKDPSSKGIQSSKDPSSKGTSLSSDLRIKTFGPAVISMIMQPSILRSIFGDKITTTIIDKDDDHYGNPGYSLQSYFEYIVSEEEDWLLHVDSTTKKQLINDDIVLIEFRLFQSYLAEYFEKKYPEVNRDAGTCSNHSGIYSIGQYREILELYKKTPSRAKGIEDSRRASSSGNATRRKLSP